MKKLLSFLGISLLLAGSVSTGIVLSRQERAVETVAATAPYVTYTTGDADTYYNRIDVNDEGADLLASLRSLNRSKKQKSISYGSLANNYQYTDYDVDTVQYDEKNQPYSSKFVAFYSGEVRNGMNGMNKEHVWPDSRGGNLVEADIHMPRPTLSSDNSSRGNSFYVEDSNSTSAGWDPKFANPCDITYRGDSARIVFYCVVANEQLSLIDETSDNKNNKTMGKLSDLIKWHLEYPILQREMNRNEGAEYLQGNRNPFIDHPEYVCKIWGNTNETTKALCAKDPYAKDAPTAISLNQSTASIKKFQTLQLSVASVVPEDADTNVKWSTNNSSIATVSENGLVTGTGLGDVVITATSIRDDNVKATCSITVSEPDNVDLVDISVSPATISFKKGNSQQLTVTTTPSFVYPLPTITYKSNNANVATVDNEGKVTAVKDGSTTITVTVTQGETVKTKSVSVTVVASGTYEPVTSVSSLNNDDRVVLALNLEGGNGITGLGENTRASISANKEEWKEYVVKNASTTFSLYDESESSYIATPSTNTFNYSSDEPAALTVDADGRLLCNGRYLAANGNICRFYQNGQSYPAFHVYAVNTGSSTGGDDEPPVDDTVYVTSVTLDKTTADMKVGDILQLTATVLPENADDKSVSWSSDNNEVATVSNTGLVTAVAAGEVTITVTTVDGGFIATCAITISENIDDGGNGEEGGEDQPGGNGEEDQSGEDNPEEDPPEQSGGDVKVSCGGNIIATSIILSTISLLGIALLLVKKHMEK